MNLQHLNVKIMVGGGEGIDYEAFIPIFHHWIQKKVTKERLIDVADYLHVPEGPGVMLIAHEAFLSMDHSENRWGFLYNRRAPLEGSNLEKMKTVIQAALGHAHRLEQEPTLSGKLKFRGEEIQLIANDRLLAPNSEETFKSLEHELKTFIEQLYAGAPYSLTRHPDPRERFTLDVKASRPFDIEALHKNLS
jgi:hypothetical protein